MLSKLGLNNFSLQDVKAVVDRMGGIEGVMATVSKVQKFMTSVKQMQPMIKLLLSSLKKSDDDDDEPVKRRRRKRRIHSRRRTSRPLTKVGPKKKRPLR